MKKINLNIISDKILRHRLVNDEFLYKIFKSILQCSNIDLVKKNYIVNILDIVRKSSKLSRRKKTCIITGSRHSILQRTGFGRQQTKRFIILNTIANIKIVK